MKLHRDRKYLKWGLTAFFVFVACALFWIIFSNLRGFYNMILDLIDILSPILFGCLFAYLMNPVMKFVQKYLDKWLKRTKLKDSRAKSISRGVSITVSVLVLLLCIYAMVAMIVPSIATSINDLLQPDRLDGYYTTVSKWLSETFGGTQIENWLNQNFDNLYQWIMDYVKKIDLTALLSGLTSSVYSAVLGIFDFFVGIIAAVYILIYKEKLRAQAKKITVALFRPERANRLFELARRTDRIFGGYFIGKIIDTIFVTIITYIGMLIMRMPYAPLISVIIGVTNIIPFFGPFLGWIPSALLLLVDDPLNALYFSIFILVLQQIEGNIIANRILGEQLGISDLWVLVAILLFGGVFGFAGMLLGVPVFAVLYTLINDAVNNRLKKKRYPLDTALYTNICGVEELPVDPYVPSASYVSVEPAYDFEADEEEEPDEE